MDILSFIRSFIDDGYLNELTQNPAVQFGVPGRRLLGAELLPNRLSENNIIAEDLVRVTGSIANDGDPNSPPQIKVGAEGVELLVRLGHIDTAVQMGDLEMKALGRLLNNSDIRPAQEFLAQWMVSEVLLALEYKSEWQRWQMICNAELKIRRPNSIEKTLSFDDLKTSGHRVSVPSGTVASPQGWYLDTFDPIGENITPARIALEEEGLVVRRILTSTRIRDGVLARNAKVQAQTGGNFVVSATGTLETGMTTTVAALNARFLADGLPPIETYNTSVPLQGGGRLRFMPENKFVMIAETDLSQSITSGGETLLLDSTLGYNGIGVSAGQSQPGDVTAIKYSELKPVGVYAEGYRETCPVIQRPASIYVFTIDKPTA